MLKSIFTQIRNRSRSNIWIAVELLLVFCLVWYIADFLFVYGYNLSIPNHRSLKHVWQINMGEYPDAYSRYSEEESTDEAREANFERILQTLRSYPGVEAIAVVNDSSEPGRGSYYGSGFTSVEDTTRHISGQLYNLDPRKGDFFRVFSYTARNGKQAVSTSNFDVLRPNAIVLGQLEADRLFPDGTAAGKEVRQGYDGETYTVVGVIDNIKRFDYHRLQVSFYRFGERWGAKDLDRLNIVIRTRMDKPAMETFRKEMTGRLQAGNFYLKDLFPQEKVAGDMKELIVSNDIRVRIYLMAFLLLNILLCVTGAFWYRINTRREEIGIRKALGSSSAGIRNMLVLEGLCLLTLAMLPALLIEFNFVSAGLITTMGKAGGDEIGKYLVDNTALRFLITNGITWVILAAVIILAISLPARKAAGVVPADALHYE
jgi:hypothetical protein